MSNILVEALPTTIEIESQEYEVNTDFRTCLKIILAFEDQDLAAVEKSIVLVELLYKEKPDNLQLAIEKGVDFLDGGSAVEETDDAGVRVFSFEKDARLIMAGFRQTYNMDLQEVDLHWWMFLTLFMDLSPDTTFSNMVGLRRRVKTGKASKEERELAREIGEAFDLPELYNKDLDMLKKERMFFEAQEKRKKGK